MRTTVVIDDRIMAEAMRAIGAHTKKETILAGLNLLIKEKQKAVFRQELGSFDLDLDLKQLERLRDAD